MLIFILPAGGFFVFGILIALANKIAEGKGKSLPNFILANIVLCVEIVRLLVKM